MEAQNKDISIVRDIYERFLKQFPTAVNLFKRLTSIINFYRVDFGNYMRNMKWQQKIMIMLQKFLVGVYFMYLILIYGNPI